MGREAVGEFHFAAATLPEPCSGFAGHSSATAQQAGSVESRAVGVHQTCTCTSRLCSTLKRVSLQTADPQARCARGDAFKLEVLDPHAPPRPRTTSGEARSGMFAKLGMLSRETSKEIASPLAESKASIPRLIRGARDGVDSLLQQPPQKSSGSAVSTVSTRRTSTPPSEMYPAKF